MKALVQRFLPGLIHDSRGAASWAHTLAVPSVVGINLCFFFGGSSIPVPGVSIWGLTVPAFSLKVMALTSGDYITALAPWLAFLAQREYTEKVKAAVAPGGAS